LDDGLKPIILNTLKDRNYFISCFKLVQVLGSICYVMKILKKGFRSEMKKVEGEAS